MLSCDDAERLIARRVDRVLADADRVQLDAHIEVCAPCRAELHAQADVAALLRARTPEPRADLVTRVSARIDAEAGVFGLANWRAWTLGLAPIAAALMLAAYLGIGASSSGGTQAGAAAEDWTAASTPVLMQPGTSGDALVEAVLTGAAVPAREDGNVR